MFYLKLLLILFFIINNLSIQANTSIEQVEQTNHSFYAGYYSDFIVRENVGYLFNSSGLLLTMDIKNFTLEVSNTIKFSELEKYFPNLSPPSIAINNSYLYLSNQLGVYIMDISDALQPKKIGEYLLPTGDYGRLISIVGKYAYLTTEGNKIIVLDVSIPTQPAKVGEHQITANSSVSKLITDSQKLYVLTPDYLYIFDVGNNPIELKELAYYQLPTTFSEDAMALVGHYIYLLNYYGYSPYPVRGNPKASSLYVIDVSNSSAPTLLENPVDFGGTMTPRLISEGNKFLYASTGTELFKLDVSNPAKPKKIVQIGAFDLATTLSHRLVVNEPYIYRLTDSDFQVLKSVEVEAPQMTQITGLANGACDLNLSAKMLSADDGTGKNAGDFYLQWKETGRESTTSGDAVIAGYFYAPSEKVTWGSEANPEVYAKLWFAANGMLNVNFFHVGVFDVQLATSYGADMPQLNGGSFLDHNKITIGRKAWRYSRHDYTNWRSCGKTNSALGSLKVEEVPRQTLKEMAANNPKFTTSVFKSPSSSAAKININQQGSCELLMDAKMLNATSNGKPYGNLKLQWKEILRSTTSGGDTVVAGYFYGSPNEVSWGSTTNPEAYVKIWYARTGMLNVNFFHVGVFDIELTSSYKGSVPDGIDGYLTDDNNFINIWSDANRYSRHDYNNWKLCN